MPTEVEQAILDTAGRTPAQANTQAMQIVLAYAGSSNVAVNQIPLLYSTMMKLFMTGAYPG